jgi:hypothetical protein
VSKETDIKKEILKDFLKEKGSWDTTKFFASLVESVINVLPREYEHITLMAHTEEDVSVVSTLNPKELRVCLKELVESTEKESKVEH